VSNSAIGALAFVSAPVYYLRFVYISGHCLHFFLYIINSLVIIPNDKSNQRNSYEDNNNQEQLFVFIDHSNEFESNITGIAALSKLCG
jgi:hypothetical protein